MARRRDRRARGRARPDDGRPPPDLRLPGAGGRDGHAEQRLREASPPLVRLLRPPSDGPAHEPRDRRSPGRPLLPRLRPHLLLPERVHGRGRRDLRLPDLVEARAGLDGDLAGAIAVAYRYSHVSHPLLRDVQQKMADVATVAEENIVGVHVVKSFAQEDAEQQKFERRSEAVFALSVRANRQRAFYIPLLELPAAPLAGGDPADRRSHGREPFAVDRELRPLQPLPRDARHAAAGARHVDRAGAAGNRLGRAHLPGDRRDRGHRRRTRRAAAPSRRRPGRLRRRHLRLRPGAPVLRTSPSS